MNTFLIVAQIIVTVFVFLAIVGITFTTAELQRLLKEIDPEYDLKSVKRSFIAFTALKHVDALRALLKNKHPEYFTHSEEQRKENVNERN